MSIINKVKSNYLIKDELQRLHFLSTELRAGRATESDKPYWDKALGNVQLYAEHLPKFKDTYQKYKTRHAFLDHAIRVYQLKGSRTNLLIASGLHGDFEKLNVQREHNQQPEDVVIVMGDWMKDKNDTNSIQKAMDLSEEGVVFLKGANEEAFLEEAESLSVEAFFVDMLPTDIRTPYMVVTTGNSAEEPFEFSKFFTENMPNLSGKTMVFMHPVPGESSVTDNERHFIALEAGDATRIALQ